eukprot:TRINITY_DN24975_c0_g1_i2.p1 TRINITY_DN24975_c0_g1~~TRINITY_DN24975_c0_g1_i2.p1  ORF type:complete len:1469 (+),score=387.34 TRINITY_DN24975_c0_g1_i2:70-4476(+)
MPLWAQPVTIKVACAPAGGRGAEELRLLELPSGSSGTTLRQLRALLSERLGALVDPLRFTYVDGAGDELTISSDAELRAALESGVRRLRLVSAAAGRSSERKAGYPADAAADDWALVDTASVTAEGPDAEVDLNNTSTTWATRLRLWVNGEEVVVENPSPTLTLLEWLRSERGLTGTHVGCNEGGCGICTVVLARTDAATGEVRSLPINSCLRRLCGCDGCHVITTEGLGGKAQAQGLHAVQAAIAHGNGSQCGFCTPGWVMQMYSLLEKNNSPSADDVEKHFDGNLCRCTGYRAILSSFGAFAKGGAQCRHHRSVAHPPALLAHVAEPLYFEDTAAQMEWYRPTTLEQFAAVAGRAEKQQKKLRLLCAGTGAGVAKYYEPSAEKKVAEVVVDISILPELSKQPERANDGLRCGAAISLEVLIAALEDASRSPAVGGKGEGSAAASAYATLAAHARRIASVQIRSVASLAGNLMLARNYPAFNSDLAVILSAVGASVEVIDVQSEGKERQVLSIPQLLALQGEPLLLSLHVPALAPLAVFQTFKTAKRSAFAHAIVNFGAYLALNGDGVITSARIVVAGATKAIVEAKATAQALVGRRADQASFEEALDALMKEVRASASTDPRHTQQYREQLAAGFLYKSLLAAQPALPARLRSALAPLATAAARPVSCGSESFGTDPAESPISTYVPKRSAEIQASGEALYPSDYGGAAALYGQPVISTRAGSKLIALDPSEALKMPGVQDFITASAVPGKNLVQPSASGDNLKEKLFFEVNDVIPCAGALLGIVIADSWQQAHEAAKSVVQHFASGSATGASVATSVHDARQLRRIAPAAAAAVSSGTTSGGFHGRRGAKAEHAAGVDHRSDVMAEGGGEIRKATGNLRTGGQTHFYMETQAVCVVPHDGDQLEVIISDQYSDMTQNTLAEVLNVPMHHVNVKVPRAGGGFGGKLSRQLICAGAAAVAARRLRRPVRMQLDRSDDMEMCGGREPIDFEYSVTFDASTGRVQSLDMDIYLDGGWFYGDAAGDMAMAVGWSDNCYHYPKFKVTPHGVTTDTRHNTSMRAPGCMQSILAAESIIEHVARTVGQPVEKIQELNFYRLSEAPTTPFGDKIGQGGFNWTIPTLWSQLQEQARYAQRQIDVAAFNAANRWRKRGIALSPVKYVMDISGTNYSSGALVNIYSDGTVLVSSGGSEVGQGLTTKVALCVANALQCPFEKVVVGPRETSKVPDNTATGGSGTSECSAEAASLACEKLVELLRPYRKKGVAWEAAVAAATADKVGLMSTAWFKYKNTGNTNSYATYGTAAAEVEVDVLTGEVRVERVDVLMDLGTQLDAAVDIGQLQGGFVIALGYLLTEDWCLDANTSRQLNAGTWEYKIPSAYDIPVEFNVSLLRDSPNPVGIKGSKASAEPAMCLIPSVYLALKQAIYAARSEVGLGEGWFELNVPATPSVIRAAMAVPAAQMRIDGGSPSEAR